MRNIKLIFISLLVIIINFNVAGQQAPSSPTKPTTVLKSKKDWPKKSSKTATNYHKFSLGAGLGIANYFGDLMEHNRLFSQPGFSFSISGAYSIARRFDIRLNGGLQQVKAQDSKNSGTQYKARNLSFKSNVTDVSLSLDWFLLNIKKHGFSPYVTAGVGAMFFNPTAVGASGKQHLRELGTEGQGIAGYPGIYRTSAVIIPLGFGVKIATGKRLSVLLDFSYRLTGTDYLDDVSSNRYPNKTALDAKNPLTSKFTWRGGEVGGEPYPSNLNLPRGNPSNRDAYYTSQIKFVYAFNKNSEVKEKTEVLLPVINNVVADRDADGIADSIDKCPDVKGSIDNGGCPLAEKIENGDRDSDGIADSIDKCPDVSGSIENFGCPASDKVAVISDRDGDGIPDAQDKCPDVSGTIENNGCPFPVIEGAEILKSSKDSMTFYVFFDLDRAIILPDAFKSLNSIVRIMQADKSLYVILGGHTDTLGSRASNIELSKQRAYVTRDYLLSYQISANRIITRYFGETIPLYNIQQWRNRRVEITLYKK